MSVLVVVREHARLTTTPIEPSLDRATITPSAFSWLCRVGFAGGKGGAHVVLDKDSHWLRLGSYVGVMQTPCGTTIEILPKHHESEDEVGESRKLLWRMIADALDIPAREASAAELELFDGPLCDWMMRRFLEALEHLVQRGVRFDYDRVEEEQRFQRGQLDTARQVHQPVGKSHHFHIRHDIFLPNGPENRLVKTALEQVCRQAASPDVWRKARGLRTLLAEVPRSFDVELDFRAWRADRLMAHYGPIRPWCELILSQQVPLAVRGEWGGTSMLFPMERLFERCVQAALRRGLARGYRLTSQSSRHALCSHLGVPFFQLRPDFVIEAGRALWILDAKWKRLDQDARDSKYGLSQADFYQLFAYGQKYRNLEPGGTELVLIYPRTATFTDPLPPFAFDESMKIWVVPFDLGAVPPRLHFPSASALSSFMKETGPQVR